MEKPDGWINSNMRCIEIWGCFRSLKMSAPINSNMRCIEMQYRRGQTVNGIDKQ